MKLSRLLPCALSIALVACKAMTYDPRAYEEPPPPPPPPGVTVVQPPVAAAEWVCTASTKGLHFPSFAPPRREPPAMKYAVPLLETEAAQLTKLLATFKSTDAQWVVIARRLAQTLRAAELGAAHETRVKQELKDADGFEAQRARYEAFRGHALKLYAAIVEVHPNDPKSDADRAALADELADRAIFTAGDEAKARTDRGEAIHVWVGLLKAFPQSPFAPIAYRFTADYFFETAAAGQGDWSVARVAYERALTGAASTGVTHEEAYIHARLAYVAWNQGELAEAKKHFDRALAILNEDGLSARAEEITRDVACARSAL